MTLEWTEFVGIDPWDVELRYFQELEELTRPFAIVGEATYQRLPRELVIVKKENEDGDEVHCSGTGRGCQ